MNTRGGCPADAASVLLLIDQSGFFILSVGRDISLAHQQDMATAGVGKPIDGSLGNAPYYGAENSAELRAAFDAIIGGVRSCTFTLSSSVNPGQADEGVVILNGVWLVHEDPDGWTLVDATTLELLGDACKEFLKDKAVSLTAEFPCPVITGRHSRRARRRSTARPASSRTRPPPCPPPHSPRPRCAAGRAGVSR